MHAGFSLIFFNENLKDEKKRLYHKQQVISLFFLPKFFFRKFHTRLFLLKARKKEILFL